MAKTKMPPGQGAATHRGCALEVTGTYPPYTLEILDAESRTVVAVKRDGSVQYGPGYTTDQAASRKFWEAVGHAFAKSPTWDREQLATVLGRHWMHRSTVGCSCGEVYRGKYDLDALEEWHLHHVADAIISAMEED